MASFCSKYQPAHKPNTRGAVMEYTSQSQMRKDSQGIISKKELMCVLRSPSSSSPTFLQDTAHAAIGLRFNYRNQLTTTLIYNELVVKSDTMSVPWSYGINLQLAVFNTAANRAAILEQCCLGA